jgi:hypothetical protein
LKVSRIAPQLTYLIDPAFYLDLISDDAIVVPEKLRASSSMNEFLQAAQLLSQLALTAAALSEVK